MTYTQGLSVITQYIADMINDNLLSLRIKEVFYGDNVNISQWPSVCVEPGSVDSSQLAGVPLRVDNSVTVYIMVYHGSLGQSMERTKKECLELSEDIKDYINTDHTMGGLVVQGWVTNFEPGYVKRGNFMTYATRITWTGLSRTLVLPTTG